ncbi:hypothetical protein B0T19DRAFT_157955 [Cercophora scortea]|uniref:Uncharacterized protein n=1 Tax=Cercophora scortea TaxID=314031 RepID=A0AAE0MC99_9PEZI|nr:hypothetical protein B0T19DRAFT_157955 [Cercophora scortea]
MQFLCAWIPQWTRAQATSEPEPEAAAGARQHIAAKDKGKASAGEANRVASPVSICLPVLVLHAFPVPLQKEAVTAGAVSTSQHEPSGARTRGRGVRRTSNQPASAFCPLGTSRIPHWDGALSKRGRMVRWIRMGWLAGKGSQAIKCDNRPPNRGASSYGSTWPLALAGVGTGTRDGTVRDLRAYKCTRTIPAIGHCIHP